MNTSHRSLWNAALGAWVAVSEITKARGKRSGAVAALAVACSSAGAQTIIDGGAAETVPGTQSSPWALAGDLHVGESGVGTLTLAGGGQVSNNRGYIGFNASGTGTVTVTGAGSTWTSSGDIVVGNNGTGTLSVTDGGTVNGMTGYIGSGAGSTGTATVTGAGSTWTSSSTLLVGNDGNGTLSVAGGGTISSTAGLIGGDSAATGTITVTGPGSTWTNSNDLAVGRSGNGTLNIEGGGKVSNTLGSLGFLTGSTGTVTVTGAGSIWTNNHNAIYVGVSGNGTLNVADGGIVSIDSGTGVLGVALSAGSTGVVNIGAAPGNPAQAAGALAAAGLNFFGAGTGSLNFNHTETAYTFALKISGAGAVNQIAGTTLLTGFNTYTGGTTVSGGTLAGNTNSLQRAITNNAAVTFEQNTNGTYAGVMSGTGVLTKTGTGTLTLSGANTYGGGTVMNAGTLKLNNATALGTGALTVTGASTLDSNTAATVGNNITLNTDMTVGGSNNLTLNGTVSGAGGLVKNGIASLTLGGNNTFTGLLDVQAGNVVAQGTGALASASGANVGASGLLDLTADTSLAKLTGLGTVNIGAGNTLSLGDNTPSSSFAGNLTGTGALTKLGTGNLILTGTSTYNGATSVNAGTLSVNGSIGSSAVTVNSGGILGGSGTVGTTSIASGGILAPGNSIGTLTVNGNLSIAAGSTYRVEVDAAGANDRINATGTATINGGTVDVQASAGGYQASTQYTILNAAGGRTGNFAGVTSNLAFLTPTLGYDANNVFLTLARNDISFSAVAVTPNQIAISTALQNANAGATGDMSIVQTALTGLSAVQARAAYDSASGSGIVALRQTGSNFANAFGSQLQARLGAQVANSSAFANSFSSQPVLLAANDHLSDLMAPVSDSGPQKFSLAAGASSLSSSLDPSSRGLWIRGYGGYGNTNSDGNAAASNLRSSGLSFGFDAEVKDGLRLGVAATGGTSRLSTDNNESGKTRSSAVALYGSYATGPWNFSGSASVSWGKNHLDRNVVVGAISRTASSDFDSNTLSAYGEATYSLPMNGWTLQPLAGLSISRNKADGFTETGAGALNLQVAGQTINSSKSMLGAKASFDTGRIRFEPRGIWAHEFGDLNTPMTAQFQGAASASPFLVSGAALKRDTLILGLGATGSISKGIDLFADIQAEHNAAQRNLAALVGLRSRW